MKLILVILLSIYSINANSGKYCYLDDETPFVLFGTNTAYEFVHGTKIQSFPKCDVKSIWILARHGTRDPPQASIEGYSELTQLRDQIVKNHLEGRGELCAKDLGNLRDWEFPYDDETDAELTDEGRKELYELGIRLKESFPTIFQANYSSDNFQFHASKTNRTQESIRLIVKGIFGEKAINDVLPSRERDLLTNTGQYCDRFTNEVSRNEDSTEQSLFEESSYVKNVVKDVSQRLGFEKDLTFEDIKSAWDICTYEKATDIQSHPPLCALFTSDDSKVMEYHADLGLYYGVGYGTSLASKIACPLVRNMLLHFLIAASEDPNPKRGIIYNSHVEMLLPLFTSLSMFKDDVPPKHDNYESMQSRSWRTSFIGPFTSNLVSVLYNCSDELKIAFYVNEKIYNYPKCNKGLCPWEYVYQKLNSYVDCTLSFCDDDFTSKDKKSSAQSKNNSTYSTTTTTTSSTKSTTKKGSTSGKSYTTSATEHSGSSGGKASMTTSSSTKSQGKKSEENTKQH